MAVLYLVVFAAVIGLGYGQLNVIAGLPPTEILQLYSANCTQYAQYAQMLGMWHPTCNFDGTYQPMQLHPSNTTLCLSKDGKLLFNGTSSLVKSCTCHRQRYETQQPHLIGAFVPKCELDGTYSAMQFHASTGYVKCFSSNGTELLSGRNIVDCRCPRARFEAQRPLGMVGMFVPQCEADGTYSAMQYHGSTGYVKCFSRDGIEILTGRNIVSCQCPRARYEAQRPGLLGTFIPRCEDDGTYSPMQVHGSTGFVKCYSVDGTELLTGRGITDCRCPRARYEAQRPGLIGAFVPQCEADGTYSAMQFHGSTGYVKCFSTNGTELMTGRNIVDCQCARARYEAQRPGLIGTFVPQCESDGTYSAMQFHASTGYTKCFSTNGTEILSGRNIRACKCPRARFEAQRPGMVGNYVPQCEDDGVYSRRQVHGSTGYSWCVNEDGVQTSLSVPPTEYSSLNC